MPSQSDLTKTKEAVRAGRSIRATADMRIPLRYRGKGLLQNKQSERALEILRKGESLFLTGGHGSGKTHLASALMGNWLADNLDVAESGIYPAKGTPRFLPVVELLLEIKNSWQGETEQERAILEKYSRCPLLTLDDLGAEKVSDWSRTVLYLLIDRRYRDCRQTIITSNLTQGQLAEQFDARIASRICEMGAVINMGQKDWRLGLAGQP